MLTALLVTALLVAALLVAVPLQHHVTAIVRGKTLSNQDSAAAAAPRC